MDNRAAAIARLMAQPWGPPITDQPKGQTMQTAFTSIFGGTVTPQTRADLLTHHPAFSGLNADSDGNPCVWINNYCCQSCTSEQINWQSEWSCQCDDDCPQCRKSHVPESSEWIAECGLWAEDGSPADTAYRLWESLPEAGATYPTPIMPGAMVKAAPTDQPKPMWLCVWVTNYGDNELRDSFTIHESEAEALAAYDLLMIVNQNLHSAAIAPVSKATEPHWQDQR